MLVECALDLSILSLGATGAVFDNAKVTQVFGLNAALLAIALIAVNLVFSSIIVMAKAHAIRKHTHFSLTSGILTLSLGAFTLSLTAAVLAWVYWRT